MNDQDYLENIIFDGVEGAPQEKKPDPLRPIIIAVAAFLLLFSIILALTIALINSRPTPKLDPETETEADVPADLPAAIEEHRARPESLPSAANAETSETIYRPSNGTGYVNISGDSSIKSSAVLLEDLDDMTVIAGKNVDTKVQIASMTKVMTLIVACDLIKDYYGVITVKYEDRLKGYQITFVDSKKTLTEKVYYIDALYGLILYSGADCAYGIAESLCGTEEKFVEKMNEKAAALGMTGTHFSSCVGKDDGGNNYSTMRDVATMFAYALKNELCYEILTTDLWQCIGLYDCKSIHSIVHKQFKDRSADGTMTFGKIKALGGKSGNETLAKYCLVSFGEKSDGHRYICVTAGNPNNSYEDTINVYKNYVK